MAAGRRGHVVVTSAGARKLVAVSPLPALGWSYVVVADEAHLLAGGG
jgi:hypothetical protein